MCLSSSYPKVLLHGHCKKLSCFTANSFRQQQVRQPRGTLTFDTQRPPRHIAASARECFAHK